MALKKRMALLILVLLLLGTPLALLAAGETAVPSSTPTLAQTAVRAVLPFLVEPDCDQRTEAPRPETFDPARPVPNCWLAPHEAAAYD